MRPYRRILPLLALLSGVSTALMSCGSDGPTDGGNPPEVQPFVGTWTATALVQTSTANTDKTLDIVDGGGSFTLTIQASGRYLTELVAFSVTATEEGRVEVIGQDLVFYSDAHPDRADPAEYQLSGNSLTLEGSSTFDFNDGQGAVPTTLHIELER